LPTSASTSDILPVSRAAKDHAHGGLARVPEQELAQGTVLLSGAGSDDPHVLLIRGLALMAQPDAATLRSGVVTLEQAAGKGDVKSMAVLAVLHIIGVPGIQHDLEKGQKLILNAAAKDDVDAARVVARDIYRAGWAASIPHAR
jgi:TPR repeat protein